MTLWHLRCRDAAKLLTQRLDRPLAQRETWALRWHLWLCPPCRRFARQMHMLGGAMGAWRSYRAEE
ncbi:hypothetical protein VITFI_CDS2004 [Vitreoscilla filiformis]|jgi:Putative zinc-finger|uniref:Putative zinc-finger domain-containing protein n=1 Tax=Vitreoscilla filiformis TaxID=63 RepID=A0A221KFF4_VITFI|nr:zf-HC2 domain-containing protein [Vitreoscilla filiformis]ASM77782.1 hypothetical protein VITFI_CDS2004 [Vitreoscilla filiformis]